MLSSIWGGLSSPSLVNASRGLQMNNAVKSLAVAEDHKLMDMFGRQHKYLRISLTEKCNLRCSS